LSTLSNFIFIFIAKESVSCFNRIIPLILHVFFLNFTNSIQSLLRGTFNPAIFAVILAMFIVGR